MSPYAYGVPAHIAQAPGGYPAAHYALDPSQASSWNVSGQAPGQNPFTLWLQRHLLGMGVDPQSLGLQRHLAVALSRGPSFGSDPQSSPFSMQSIAYPLSGVSGYSPGSY